MSENLSIVDQNQCVGEHRAKVQIVHYSDNSAAGLGEIFGNLHDHKLMADIKA